MGARELGSQCLGAQRCLHLRHCEERSDEAIPNTPEEIASLRSQ